VSWLFDGLKKLRMKDRAAHGSVLGRYGRRRKGVDKPVRMHTKARHQLFTSFLQRNPPHLFFWGGGEFPIFQFRLSGKGGGNLLSSMHAPLDFTSAVHTRSSSCTSSGDTSVLSHPSVHLGADGWSGTGT